MIWDVSWNPVWKGKVGTEDSAWVAEMEIPLSQLRYSKEDEQSGASMYGDGLPGCRRKVTGKNKPSLAPGFLYNFGELHGIRDLKKSNRLEIMPYAVGRLNTFSKEEGNPFAESGKEWGGNIGLDAKIGLTSNFTGRSYRES